MLPATKFVLVKGMFVFLRLDPGIFLCLLALRSSVLLQFPFTLPMPKISPMLKNGGMILLMFMVRLRPGFVSPLSLCVLEIATLGPLVEGMRTLGVLEVTKVFRPIGFLPSLFLRVV